INLSGIQNSRAFNLSLAGNNGGGILSNVIFGPKALLYHNSPSGFPSLPPFPIPPPQIVLPDEEPNNPWHPFVGPDFVPQEPLPSDPDPRDLPTEDAASNEPAPSPVRRPKVPDFDKEVEKKVPPEKKRKEINWAEFYRRNQGTECDIDEILFSIPRKYFSCRRFGGFASPVRYVEEGTCFISFNLLLFNFCQLDKKYAQKAFGGLQCNNYRDFSSTSSGIRVSLPCDPNEINGPKGFGESKMVSKTDDLPFTIKFENDAKFATASAQTVRVIQALDANFKPSSFALGSFGFGNQEFTIPSGQNTFSTQLDFSAEKGIRVDVAAALDLPGKRLIWSFSTIDAVTGQPSSIPESGFLPVNDSTGKGEGFVSYSIKAGDPTLTGDSLRAQASIFFDFNDPVVTNRHFNIVDALPPTTSVTSPSGIQSDTSVNLEWAATDDLGGSGAFRTWILSKKDSGP
ncbi:MAG TPA: hypothetical protein PKY12_14520, partial [Catalimonadaceae bacterium]|nr:hypothetical protein [Catalimonadaceae bacterium]